MLKILCVNIHLVKAFESIPRYARFMKKFIIRKKVGTVEDVDGVHHCSAVRIGL